MIKLHPGELLTSYMFWNQLGVFLQLQLNDY